MNIEKDIAGETMVTEENLNQFKEYLNIKMRAGVTDKKGLRLIAFLFLMEILVFAAGACLFSNVGLRILSSMLAFSIAPVGVSIIQEKALKKLKNKYPDFDISLSAPVVVQLIDNFETTSIKDNIVIKNTSKNNELNGDDMLDYISSFDKMSVDEKIAFLEKEKEFWQQEKVKNELERDPIQKQIGTIV